MKRVILHFFLDIYLILILLLKFDFDFLILVTEYFYTVALLLLLHNTQRLDPTCIKFSTTKKSSVADDVLFQCWMGW